MTEQRTKRVLLATCDRHTRGINNITAFLRSAGFEVIYLGHCQSPESIAAAALEEDPDVVGVSILSGAHKKILEKLAELFKNAGDERVIMAGGIIPAKDHKKLKKLGINLIFSPSASIEKDIIPAISALVPKCSGDVDSLFEKLIAGEKNALAKFITLLVCENWLAVNKLMSVPQKERAGFRIGFTGGGGVGKSSLISALIKRIYKETKVAAIFADPPAVSGGAVLGDRVRLHQTEDLEVISSPNVFIRSLAAHKIRRGVAPAASHIASVLKQAGFEMILVESVGVGQYDVGFKEEVDLMVWVLNPGMGDEIQMLKGGAIETADIIIVNKSDRAGAATTVSLLKQFFPQKPILSAISSPGKSVGIPELWNEIESFSFHPDVRRDRC